VTICFLWRQGVSVDSTWRLVGRWWPVSAICIVFVVLSQRVVFSVYCSVALIVFLIKRGNRANGSLSFLPRRNFLCV
jgi:hypothetical protein